MKENQIMKLGEEEFKIKGVINKEDLKNKTFKGIYQCYDRPSKTKINIFLEWVSKIYDIDNNFLKFGIDSYNCNMFTLHSILKIDNKKYYIHITKTRQEIYEVID